MAPLAAVLASALAARMLAGCLFQWFVARSGTARLCVFPDTEYYWLLARTIRAGAAYEVVEWGTVHRLALRTPGYPLFLAACQALFGESTLAVRMVQAALGTFSVWLVYRLTRQLDAGSKPDAAVGPGAWSAPLIAGAVAAVYPFSVAISEVLLSEALFIPLLLLLLWGMATLWRLGDEPDPAPGRAGVQALATGAAAGAAILTKPSFALFLPAALLGWLIAAARGCDGGRRRQAWRGSVLALLGAAAVMSPWWIRNVRVLGRFVPTSVWLGASLYDGLNPNATGASNMKFRDEPEFRRLSELDQDAALTRRAIQFARTHPPRVLELAVIKLLRYWSPWPNAEEYHAPALAVVSTVVVVPFYLLFLAGVWHRRCDLRALVLLAGPLLYFCAVHLVFVSSVRYRVAGELPAMALAAMGLKPIVDRVHLMTSRNRESLKAPRNR
jgi:4-amino-4-deoxy-L-arabinose transferase-like glycosyltransferase